jgi:hypothetical protein
MKKTNLFWILPLLIIALLAGMFFYTQKSLSKLTVTSWQDNGLHIYPGIERPHVVTHLIAPGDSQSHYKSAALESPLLIWDSAGRILDYEEIKKLKWVNYLGDDAEPPKAGSNISVIYYRADTAQNK